MKDRTMRGTTALAAMALLLAGSVQADPHKDESGDGYGVMARLRF